MASPTITPASVPQDALDILAILCDELQVPQDVRELRKNLNLTGSRPILPHPHKSQALATALFALIGMTCSRILQLRKFDHAKSNDFQISVDSDQSTLFLCSFLFGKLGGHTLLDPEFGKIVPKINEEPSTGLRNRLTELYKTKDGRFFTLHSSLHGSACLRALGLDPELPVSAEEARKILEEKCLSLTAEELRQIMVKAGIVGDICLKSEEYDESEQGKIISKLKLSSLLPVRASSGLHEPAPTPFTPLSELSSTKPLAGFKVVELTRVIAGPVGGRLLAELGATVVRVIDGHLTDFSLFQPEFNVDKRNVFIDLKSEVGKKQMSHLLETADVFLQGYRPGAMDRLGLGHQFLADLAAKRGKSLVIVDENCYGGIEEGGPWANRPGYQQIADTLTGLAWQNGHAVGLDNPIIPCFPISDHCAGQLCALMAILGLLRSSRDSGSVTAPVALSSLDFFVRKLEQYPTSWVKQTYESGPPLDFDWGFAKLAGAQVQHMKVTAPQYFRPEFFEVVPEAHFGGKSYEFVHLAPVLHLTGVDNAGKTTGAVGAHSVGWDNEDAKLLAESL